MSTAISNKNIRRFILPLSSVELTSSVKQTKTELAKFNENHDPSNGEFSSGSGGSAWVKVAEGEAKLEMEPGAGLIMPHWNDKIQMSYKAPEGYKNSALYGEEESVKSVEEEKSLSKTWTDTLSIEEKETIKEYTGARDADSINEYLRKGTGDESKRVSIIDSALAKSPGMDEDRVVYRGLELKGKPPKVGSIIEDSGYASTTLDYKLAERFSVGIQEYNPKVRKGTSVLHIAASKGTPGAFVREASYYPKASEFTMPRGSKLYVDGLEKDTRGITHIYVHVVK